MNNIPTILIANGIMNAGGTETLIMEMLRHQTGRVRYIMLIHYAVEITKGVFDEEIRALGVQMVYIKSVGSLGIKGYCQEFQKVVGALGQIDIIHSHLNANGGIICMAAKQMGIKYRICHCHADIKFKGSKMQNLKEEISLAILKVFVNHYGNRFWACSKAAWKRLFYGWHNQVVIPNMIDAEKYLSSPEEREKAKAAIGMEGKLVIGSVGRVARIKNYELAISTIAELKMKGTEAHFVCYGRFDENDAYCSQLLNQAKEMGVTEFVHFKGNTTQVAQDIKAFDVFLMPSTTEGFGMAAIEAQAAGIPTLLSTGVPRIVDIESGLASFYPLNDTSKWVEGVQNALHIPRPSNEKIMECFDAKGYNSRTMTKVIENKYLNMINQ